MDIYQKTYYLRRKKMRKLLIKRKLLKHVQFQNYVLVEHKKVKNIKKRGELRIRNLKRRKKRKMMLKVTKKKKGIARNLILIKKNQKRKKLKLIKRKKKVVKQIINSLQILNLKRNTNHTKKKRKHLPQSNQNPNH